MLDHQVTFESLPNAVQSLKEDVDWIKEFLMSSNSSNEDAIENPIGINEACQLLDWAKPTIYTKVSKGLIPFHKKGKKLYFFRSELIDYLKSDSKKNMVDAEDFLVHKKRSNNE